MLDPLHKALHLTVSRRSRETAASLTQVLGGFITAMDADRAAGISGPPLLRASEGRLTSYFDHSTQASAIQRLTAFDVAPDVSLTDFLSQLKLLVSSTMGIGCQTGRSDAMCPLYIRNSVTEQSSTLMPSLFPGALVHLEVPYPSVDAMWSACVNRGNNVTPAIRGDKYSTACSQSTSVPSSPPSGSRSRPHNSPRFSWVARLSSWFRNERCE